MPMNKEHQHTGRKRNIWLAPWEKYSLLLENTEKVNKDPGQGQDIKQCRKSAKTKVLHKAKPFHQAE